MLSTACVAGNQHVLRVDDTLLRCGPLPALLDSGPALGPAISVAPALVSAKSVSLLSPSDGVRMHSIHLTNCLAGATQTLRKRVVSFPSAASDTPVLAREKEQKEEKRERRG